MHAPIKNFTLQLYTKGDVTQYFGENATLYRERLDLEGHNGIDIVAPHGTPMYAVESGVVVEVNDNPNGFGKHVRLITHGENGDICREWTYGHCHRIHVRVGDVIEEGHHIADMGNTGFVVSGSTPFWQYNPYAGTHLHLGLRMVKRTRAGWSYPLSDIRIKVLDYDNGYKGAIDPHDYLISVSDDLAERTRLLTIISLLNQVVGLYKKLRQTT